MGGLKLVDIKFNVKDSKTSKNFFSKVIDLISFLKFKISIKQIYYNKIFVVVF